MRAKSRLKTTASLLLLAARAAAAGSGFSFTGLNSRLVTTGVPAIFSYSNPHDSAGTIQIYDMRGHRVTTIPVVAGGPIQTSVTWRPQTIAAGVYIYVIMVEDTTYSGALVVLR